MPIPNLPAPNNNFLAYERTSQVMFLDGVTANQAQVGTAAPVNSKIYGMVGVVSRGQLPYNLVMQVDVASGTLTPGTVVNLLGSLDGVNFYVLGNVVLGAGGQIQPFSGLLARYLAASLTNYVVASGAPAITVSFAA